MALDATKWQYRTDKSIRYTGPAVLAETARRYILRIQSHVRKTVVLASRLF